MRNKLIDPFPPGLICSSLAWSLVRRLDSLIKSVISSQLQSGLATGEGGETGEGVWTSAGSDAAADPKVSRISYLGGAILFLS